jgi:diguanylate cyclase (GGDEF)-like protein
VVSTREDGTLPPTALARLAELADLLAPSIIDAERRRRLVRDAATDPLTGLLNRRAFDERLGHEVARARRERRELALVLVDLDHFKAINDRDGHLAGDRVLRQVAAALAAVVRDGDLAARLGGDEFALVLRDADAGAGEAVAQRVRAALAAAGAPAVTVSAGVCALGDLPDAQALTAAADAALYATKRAGRDGCTTWPTR